MLRHDGKDFGITVLWKMSSDPVTNAVKMLVRCEGETIMEGDSLFINPQGTIVDIAGNHAHANNPKMPVILKSGRACG